MNKERKGITRRLKVKCGTVLSLVSDHIGMKCLKEGGRGKKERQREKGDVMKQSEERRKKDITCIEQRQKSERKRIDVMSMVNGDMMKMMLADIGYNNKKD